MEHSEHSDNESENDSSSDELESELYSILHYNASDDFPPDILAKYDIIKNGDEIRISLKKNPLCTSESGKPNPSTSEEKRSIVSDLKKTPLKEKRSEPCSSTCKTKINQNKKGKPLPDKRFDSSESCTKSLDKPFCANKRTIINGKVNSCTKDFIVIHDSESDSDVIIEEPDIPITAISSDSDICILNDSAISSESDYEVCAVNFTESSSSSDSHSFRVNDSDGNDTMFLNISNRSTTIFPEDSGTEEESIEVDWRKVASPSTWSDSMKKYYNKPCKKLKEFDYKQILQEIKGQGTWFINSDDKFPSRRKPYKRCNLCRQTDHLINNCPKRFSNCAMCGNSGHEATRCPNAMCFNCGSHYYMYVAMCNKCEMRRHQICDECKQIGHIKSNCPDTWRRFNLTIKGDLVPKPDVVNEKLLCCNCGKRGHLFENCTSLYWSRYPPTSFLPINKNNLKIPKGVRHLELNNFSSRSPKRAKWSAKRDRHSVQPQETQKKKKRRNFRRNRRQLNYTI